MTCNQESLTFLEESLSRLSHLSKIKTSFMFYKHSFRQLLSSILRHKKCKSKAFKRFSGHSALLKEGEWKLSILVDGGGPKISSLMACSTATAGSLQAAAFPVEYLASGLAGLAGMDAASKGSISILNGLDALEATVATAMAKRTMLEMLAAGGGSLADDDGVRNLSFTMSYLFVFLISPLLASK